MISPILSRTRTWAATLLLAAGLGLAACSGVARIDSVDAGRTTAYAPGVPNFDLEALVTWREDRAGIDLYLGVPYASLIFLRTGDEYKAVYEFTVQVQDRKGKSLDKQAVWTDTLSVRQYELTQRYQARALHRRIAVEPGEYLLEVTLRDASSDKSAVRKQRVVIPAPSSEPSLSLIHMEARMQGGPFEPVLALHLPSDLDSMRAVVELNNPSEMADVQMTLLRLESDTSIAQPPFWLTPMSGSLAYRGINYSHSRSDTLQVTRRTLRGADEAVTVEFVLPDLPIGIYRVDIRAQLKDASGAGKEVTLQERRDISVKGPEFPRVTTLDQLVEALAYIAHEREIRHIMAAETVEEKRKRFDAFWGGLVGNRQVAHNLIKLYYSRVEEANLFFSTHKEGWKTDRGMVYIILGAPMFIETLFDAEVWHYSYSDRDPLTTFVFERVKPYGAEAIFENYLLARRPYYERVWSRAIDRWRSGHVL